MLNVLIRIGRPLVLGASLLASHVHAGTCDDTFELTFGAKLKGAPYWLSPTGTFVAKLPAVLTSEEGGALLEARISRATPEFILIEYLLRSPTRGVDAALIRVELQQGSSKPFSGSTVDQAGNTWSLSTRPLCHADA